MTRVPFAWLNVTADRQKLVFSMVAIGFAVFLMLIQIGFKQALVDSNTAFLRLLDYDLLLVSKRRYTSFIEQTFPRSVLHSARSVNGVIDGCALYQTTSIWKPAGVARRRPIRVYAVANQCQINPLRSAGINPHLLQADYSVIADQLSRPEYGSLKPGVRAELDGRRVRVVAGFELGSDFSADGTLILSDATFLRLFSDRPTGIEANPRPTLEQLDMGILQVDPRADLRAVQKRIRQNLPADVIVLSKNEMLANEERYWNGATPIGFLFNLGTVMGFVVGVLIVRNLLATELDNNSRQYATLKAIGHSNRTLRQYVVQQGLLLGGFGIPCGILLSSVVYAQVSRATGLTMRLHLQTVLAVSALTLIMGVASGWLAARKLQGLDPVSVLESQT